MQRISSYWDWGFCLLVTYERSLVVWNFLSRDFIKFRFLRSRMGLISLCCLWWLFQLIMTLFSGLLVAITVSWIIMSERLSLAEPQRGCLWEVFTFWNLFTIYNIFVYILISWFSCCLKYILKLCSCQLNSTELNLVLLNLAYFLRNRTCIFAKLNFTSICWNLYKQQVEKNRPWRIHDWFKVSDLGIS